MLTNYLQNIVTFISLYCTSHFKRLQNMLNKFSNIKELKAWPFQSSHSS